MIDGEASQTMWAGGASGVGTGCGDGRRRGGKVISAGGCAAESNSLLDRVDSCW
jgi:hypothetical protein